MDLQSARSFIATSVAAGALAFSAFACGGGDSATQGGGDPGPGGGFESDNPSGAAAASGSPGPGAGAGGAGGAGGMGGNGGGAGTGSQPPGDDANRAIEEADIIQVDADKLYALSRYGGLSVIDVARPEQLRMLGRFRTEATPFEMYVKSNVVLGLFTEWGRYVTTANGWQWVQTSQVIALDASDPANIRSLGEFSVAGAISDSRIVGNILYVVSYQNGSCWECASAQPRTVISSLDISNPSAVKKVDELVYDDVNDQWGWGARSITVTDQRMYVGGREWRDGIGGSTIQVVDISNPNGDLVPGTSVQAEGQITSRWQMDEYQGTLRVLSQPWQGTATPPILQTYRVESAQSVVPLARMPLVLPRPEQLQSTRFDGTRAYAITFERTDPLFTIDLTNPAAPRQMGELEMPGWIYHMEPRGDRLYGLGFDQNNPAGALNVSIFDVSNLSAPKLVDRVNFGANWGYLPEDQDRIHKAFRLLDEQGLILVPYAGYSYTTHENYCGGSYRSGVQLIDFTRDDLVMRGSAPSYGEARRAFLHRDRLFTVSDDRVQSFDIANRDAPAKLHQVSLAREVLSAAVAGDHLVRLGNDWWSRTAQIDVTPLNGADAPNGLGGLDLESILGSSCGSGFYGARVLGNGNRAYVVYDQYVYEGDGTQKTAVAVIDVSNPAAPRVESHQSIGVPASYAWGGWGYDSVVASGERLIQIGSTLVFAHVEGSWTNGSYVSTQASLVVVDLADPTKPRTAILRLPNAQGLTGLHVDGSTILTSHFEPVAGAPGRVRFYVDRIDVSNPAAPRFVGKINVPGSLFAWEPETGRAITVDYRRSVEQGVTMQDCYNEGGYGRASWVIDDSLRYDVNATGTCHIVNHSLRQVRIDSATATAEGSWDVPGDLQLGRADVAARRVYVGLNRSYGYYHDGCYTGGCAPVRAAELLVLSGFELGALRTSTLPLTAQPWGGYIYHLLAFGDRALVAADSGSELLVVDASTPTQLKTIRTIDTYGYVYSLQKHGDLAIIASGHDGAQVMDVRR